MAYTQQGMFFAQLAATLEYVYDQDLKPQTYNGTIRDGLGILIQVHVQVVPANHVFLKPGEFTFTDKPYDRGFNPFTGYYVALTTVHQKVVYQWDKYTDMVVVVSEQLPVLRTEPQLTYDEQLSAISSALRNS